MRAGTLNKIITILQPKVIINDVGEQTTEYYLKFQTMGKTEYNSGNRSIENNEIIYNYQKTFYLRIYADVNENDRVLLDGKQYRILSIEKNKEFQECKIVGEMVNE